MEKLNITGGQIPATPENYKSLRAAYLLAFDSRLEVFSWNGIELTTLFAGFCLASMEEILTGEV